MIRTWRFFNDSPLLGMLLYKNRAVFSRSGVGNDAARLGFSGFAAVTAEQRAVGPLFFV